MKKRTLRDWQDLLSRNQTQHEADIAKMDEREAYYRGMRTMKTYVDGVTTVHEAHHVRNIVAENIESMVDSAIPQPKVTPRRKEDEWRASIIENMIRNELDRLRCEEMNDMQERTVPIQGGGFWLVEWDGDAMSHGIAGEVALSVVHPKQVIPQVGVYTSIDDMDYVILALPQTKDYIRRRYGKDVDEESESDPELRGSGDEETAEDMVTQYLAYYRSDDGKIGLYSWCNNTVLEDLEDYQARRRKRCVQCGALEPAGKQAENAMQEENRQREREDTEARNQLAHGMWETGRELGLYGDEPAGIKLNVDADDEEDEDEHCPYCGGTEFEESPDDYEEIWVPMQTAHGTTIPGASWDTNQETLEPELRPNRIPAYKPDCYPVILQKNVSLFGQLLGDSDVDKIADYQNAINWLNQKIDRKLMAAGTIITGPANTDFTMDPKDHRILRLDNPADKAMIDTYEFTGDITPEMAQLSQCYEAARQALGITDSFQGRKDTTATSGKAKEFAAAQSAGRMESKRRMKDAAWSRIFELIFKFRLAYADEPRPVVSTDDRGDSAYDMFDRYDFLERDPETGEYWWNDQFLFSCDSAAPLANSRETMWQESRMNFTSGAYGDPADPNTRVMFWAEMEELHYPLAARAKAAAEEAVAEREQAMAMQQLMAATAPMGMAESVQMGTAVPAGQEII